MKTVAIVQARMGSKRLPGKVMMEVGGKPLIGYLLDRVESVRCLDAVVLAIPLCDAGSALEKYARSRNVIVYCGNDENDVAGRFASVLTDCGDWDYFVRVCADSPLIDPGIIEGLCVAMYAQREPIISNVGMFNIPPGQHAEILDTEVFLAYEPFMSGEDREHVTSHIYKTLYLPSMAVDTMEDFQRIRLMIEKMDGDHLNYGAMECLGLLGQRLSGLA